MTPDAAPSPHSLATASGLLLGTLAAAMALGALVGWAFDAAGIGLLIGAMVGIPLGAAVVYQVYGRSASAMSAGMFSTPRPLPSRIAPTIAGGTIIALALPIFAIAGWPLAGWALGAVLWVASEIFAAVLTRLPNSPDNLAAAGMRGIGTTSRALLVGIVLVIVTVSNESVGIAAALLYAIAFTVELGVGLATYFGGEAKA